MAKITIFVISFILYLTKTALMVSRNMSSLRCGARTRPLLQQASIRSLGTPLYSAPPWKSHLRWQCYNEKGAALTPLRRQDVCKLQSQTKRFVNCTTTTKIAFCCLAPQIPPLQCWKCEQLCKSNEGEYNGNTGFILIVSQVIITKLSAS